MDENKLPSDCPKRVCPMDTRQFIERMAAIENEIKESRESRHARHAVVNRVIDEMRSDQMEMENRFEKLHAEAGNRASVMEQCLARITQLLDGYQNQGGLVQRVGELTQAVAAMPHGDLMERINDLENKRIKALEERQDKTDRRIYIATGALMALQVLAGLGAFPNLFGS